MPFFGSRGKSPYGPDASTPRMQKLKKMQKQYGTQQTARDKHGKNWEKRGEVMDLTFFLNAIGLVLIFAGVRFANTIKSVKDGDKIIAVISLFISVLLTYFVVGTLHFINISPFTFVYSLLIGGLIPGFYFMMLAIFRSAGVYSTPNSADGLFMVVAGVVEYVLHTGLNT